MGFYKNVFGIKVRQGERLVTRMSDKIQNRNLEIAELAKKDKSIESAKKGLSSQEARLERIHEKNKKYKRAAIRDRTILALPAVGATYLSYGAKKSDERLREG